MNSQPEPLAVDIPEACRLTGLGRSKLYQLLGDGELASLKIGKRRLIPIASLRDWLDRLTRAQHGMAHHDEARRVTPRGSKQARRRRGPAGG